MHRVPELGMLVTVLGRFKFYLGPCMDPYQGCFQRFMSEPWRLFMLDRILGEPGMALKKSKTHRTSAKSSASKPL